MEGSTPTWSVEDEHTKSGPSGRQGCAIAICNERIWLFGGREAGVGRTYLNDMWSRELGPGQLWEKITRDDKSENLSWPCARHNHVMIARDEHSLLLSGGAAHGELQAPGKFRQVYLHDLWIWRENCWNQLPANNPMPSGRHCHTLVQTASKKLKEAVLFGGFDGTSYCDDVWALDMQDFTWRQIKTSGSGPSKRSQHSACFCNGQMFVFGGYFYDGEEKYYGDLHGLDIETGVWRKYWDPTTPSPRNRAPLVPINEFECVLVNGNFYKNAKGTDEWYRDVFVLDTRTQKWKRLVCANDGASPKQSHLATVLHDGILYCFGGEKSMKRYKSMHMLKFK